MSSFDLKNIGRLSKNPITIFYAQWGAVYAAIFVVAVVVGIRLFAAGAKTQSEIEGVRSKMAAMPEAHMSDEQRQALMETIKSGAQTEGRQFIPVADISTALSTISATAGRYQVSLKKVNTLPAKDVAGYPYKSIPILMEAEGDFQNLGDFLAALETEMPWDFTWQDAAVKRSSTRLLQIELRIVFYTRTD